MERIFATILSVMMGLSGTAPPAQPPADPAPTPPAAAAPAGDGAAAEAPAPRPVLPPGIWAGPARSYVLMEGKDGLVQVIGEGSSSPSFVPFSNIRQIAEGDAGRFVLLRDGTVWWEDRATEPATWRELTGLTDVYQIAVGKADILTLHGGGRARRLTLTDGSIDEVPLSRVTQVTAGDGWYMVLRGDGTVWGTGDNTLGALGASAPYAVLTDWVQLPIAEVKQLIAGGGTAYFVKADGSLWGVGSNAFQTLGRSVANWTGVPVPLPFPFKVRELAASPDGRNLYALSTANEVWGLGANDAGQLGGTVPSGRTANVEGTPVKLPPRNIVAIAAGNSFLLTRHASGAVQGMGLTATGQLGMSSPDPLFHYQKPLSLPVLTDPVEMATAAATSAMTQPAFLPLARKLIWSLPSGTERDQLQARIDQIEDGYVSRAAELITQAEGQWSLDDLRSADGLLPFLRPANRTPLMDRVSALWEQAVSADTVAPAAPQAALNQGLIAITARDQGAPPFVSSGIREIRFRLDGGEWQTYQEPVALPEKATSLTAYAIDGAGNESDMATWNVAISQAEAAVSAVESFRRVTTREEIAPAEELMAAAAASMEDMIPGDTARELAKRLADASRRVRRGFTSSVLPQLLQEAEDTIRPLRVHEPEGSLIQEARAKLERIRPYIEAITTSDRDHLRLRFHRLDSDLAMAEARHLTHAASTIKTNTRSTREEITAHHRALDEASLAVAALPEGETRTTLTNTLTQVRGHLQPLWTASLLKEAQSLLAGDLTLEALDQAEFLLARARAELAGTANPSTRNTYERQVRDADFKAEIRRVSIAVNQATEMAGAVTSWEDVPAVEAQLVLVEHLIAHIDAGNAGKHAVVTGLRTAKGILIEAQAALALADAEVSLDPEDITRADNLIRQVAYASRAKYSDRLGLLKQVMRATDAVTAAETAFAEWHKEMQKYNPNAFVQLGITRQYDAYVKGMASAANLIEELPDDAELDSVRARKRQLERRLADLDVHRDATALVMQIVQKKTLKTPIPEVDIRIGPDWLLQLPALHEETLIPALGLERPTWVSFAPDIAPVDERGHVTTQKPGKATILAWTTKGVVRFNIEVLTDSSLPKP